MNEDCAAYYGGESSEMLRTNAPSFWLLVFLLEM